MAIMTGLGFADRIELLLGQLHRPEIQVGHLVQGDLPHRLRLAPGLGDGDEALLRGLVHAVEGEDWWAVKRSAAEDYRRDYSTAQLLWYGGWAAVATGATLKELVVEVEESGEPCSGLAAIEIADADVTGVTLTLALDRGPLQGQPERAQNPLLTRQR